MFTETGSLLKRILKKKIGTVKNREIKFALEQLKKNKKQVNLDYINDVKHLETSILFYRKYGGNIV